METPRVHFRNPHYLHFNHPVVDKQSSPCPRSNSDTSLETYKDVSSSTRVCLGNVHWRSKLVKGTAQCDENAVKADFLDFDCRRLQNEANNPIIVIDDRRPEMTVQHLSNSYHRLTSVRRIANNELNLPRVSYLCPTGHLHAFLSPCEFFSSFPLSDSNRQEQLNRLKQPGCQIGHEVLDCCNEGGFDWQKEASQGHLKHPADASNDFFLQQAEHPRALGSCSTRECALVKSPCNEPASHSVTADEEPVRSCYIIQTSPSSPQPVTTDIPSHPSTWNKEEVEMVFHLKQQSAATIDELSQNTFSPSRSEQSQTSFKYSKASLPPKPCLHFTKRPPAVPKKFQKRSSSVIKRLGQKRDSSQRSLRKTYLSPHTLGHNMQLIKSAYSSASLPKRIPAVGVNLVQRGKLSNPSTGFDLTDRLPHDRGPVTSSHHPGSQVFSLPPSGKRTSVYNAVSPAHARFVAASSSTRTSPPLRAAVFGKNAFARTRIKKPKGFSSVEKSAEVEKVPSPLTAWGLSPNELLLSNTSENVQVLKDALSRSSPHSFEVKTSPSGNAVSMIVKTTSRSHAVSDTSSSHSLIIDEHVITANSLATKDHRSQEGLELTPVASQYTLVGPFEPTHTANLCSDYCHKFSDNTSALSEWESLRLQYHRPPAITTPAPPRFFFDASRTMELDRARLQQQIQEQQQWKAFRQGQQWGIRYQSEPYDPRQLSPQRLRLEQKPPPRVLETTVFPFSELLLHPQLRKRQPPQKKISKKERQCICSYQIPGELSMAANCSPPAHLDLHKQRRQQEEWWQQHQPQRKQEAAVVSPVPFPCLSPQAPRTAGRKEVDMNHTVITIIEKSSVQQSNLCEGCCIHRLAPGNQRAPLNRFKRPLRRANSLPVSIIRRGMTSLSPVPSPPTPSSTARVSFTHPDLNTRRRKYRPIRHEFLPGSNSLVSSQQLSESGISLFRVMKSIVVKNSTGQLSSHQSSTRLVVMTARKIPISHWKWRIFIIICMSTVFMCLAIAYLATKAMI